MNMLVIGGDRRAGCLVRAARAAGHAADGIWLDRFDPALSCAWPERMAYDVYILPYPVAAQAGKIPTPLATAELSVAEAAAHIPPGARVLAGRGELPEGFKRMAPDALEGFALGNAVPSAEGAIFEAMRAQEDCLAGSRCLIVGYGRIARLLARGLRGLGARVTVAARKERDRALACAEGCDACAIAQIPARIGEARFVFNTAPAPVVGEEALRAAQPDALLLELASAPYGIDAQAAQRLGRRLIVAGGLPGKYAPDYAARVLLGAIEEWKEREAWK